MDDTQRDGSDSDWDSTLDFTSPRQVGIGRIPINSTNTEVEEEESALSDESDIDEQPSLARDKPVINNVLKPQEERSERSQVNVQKPNNVELAQRQQALQNKEQRRQDQPANQHAQIVGEPQPPPYNFKDAVNERITPEPATRGPPGKDRKGTTYDPAPSPTPRGIPKQQDSIRSVGSWDDSDPDERTLRDVRTNYKVEKQREEQKIREAEDRSMAEEAPQTARSESTWRSWAGNKFGKKAKSAQNSQSTPAPGQQQQQSQVSAKARAQLSAARAQPRQEPVVPPQIEVYDPRYDSLAQIMAAPSQQQGREPLYALPTRTSPALSRSRAPTPVQPQTQPTQYQQAPGARVPQYLGSPGVPAPQLVPSPAFTAAEYQYLEEDEFEEPKRLFDKDEDTGRYLYYFGKGNLHYYEVNEEYDEAVLPPVADKFDRMMQRVWREFFSLFRILFSVVLWFLVEFFRFLAHHMFRPLILGVVVTLGDFFMKPLLSAIFNGFMQPLSIFFWNVFTGMRHMFRPIGDILRRVLEQFAMLFRSIRLFELTWVSAAPVANAVQTV